MTNLAVTQPERMTQADFARHLNVGKPYVTALKKAGRLVMSDDGHVLVADSIRRIGQTQRAPERAEAPLVTEPFSEARERKEAYQAENARLDFEERCGRLTDARAVDAATANAGVLLRKRAESMPDQLAPELAAKATEEECRAILAAWVEAFLAEVAAQFATIGARARAGGAVQ